MSRRILNRQLMEQLGIGAQSQRDLFDEYGLPLDDDTPRATCGPEYSSAETEEPEELPLWNLANAKPVSCRELAESGVTVVANMRRGKDEELIAWAKSVGRFVRVDRATTYGNPYVLGRDGDRDAVCDKFAANFDGDVEELRGGRVLGCWCHPLRCHADRLVELANEDRAGNCFAKDTA